MWNPLKAELSLPSSLVQLFSSLIVQNHPAIQYYLINLKPFRALHGSDWSFCKRVGPSGSDFCKRVFAFLFLSRIFSRPLLLDLIFFCWCRPSCCCRGNWWCWAFWLQTMQGWHCQNFVSTKESNINTFHKRPPCVFPLPCHWPQVLTFGKKWKCQQY